MLKTFTKIFCLFLFSQTIYSQDKIIPIPQKSPLEKLETQVGILNVSIEYSRPSARGRKIFGELVPYNEIWRTGANLNTRITFSKTVLIGNQNLEKGAYTLFTKPGSTGWEVIFYTEHNMYGKPDSMFTENIKAKIFVPTKRQERMIETFSISFEDIHNNGCNLVLSWDHVYVEIPINVPTSTIMSSSLEETLEKTADAYAYAASNYLNIEEEAKEALKCIDFALSLHEKDMTFLEWLEKVDPKDWTAPLNYQLKSEIHAELGQFKEAIAAAERSLKICTKLVDVEFAIKKNKDNLAKWRR